MDRAWNNDDDRSLSSIWAAELDPLFWRSDRVGVESAWYGHVPFAHWLVRVTSPRCVVELGSHNGVSYAAFCGAVRRDGLGTRCFAVDTWQGDGHAGFYPEHVYDDLSRYNAERFSAFSTLIRRTFDDALELFEDGSIDILHIDGLHTYEAVRHDFEQWKPKLSSRGVVLFHDTNVRTGDFGVWRLWRELRQDYAGFEFMHAHGLGVLGVGTVLPPAVATLFALPSTAAIGAIRDRFAQLGERHTVEAQLHLLQGLNSAHKAAQTAAEDQLARVSTELAKVLADNAAFVRDVGILRMDVECAKRSETEIATRADVARLSHQATLARLQMREETCRRELAGREAAMIDLHAEVEQLRQATAKAEMVAASVMQSRNDLTLRAHEARSRADQAWAREAAAVARAQSAAQAAEAARVGQLEAERHYRSTRQALEASERSRMATEGALGSVVNSSVWKLTWPLRSGLHKLPPRVRTPLRGAAKTVWRSLTPQLNGARRIEVNGAVRDDATPQPAVAVAYGPTAIEPPVAHGVATRIVLISGEHHTPGTIYRVERPAAALRAAGYDCAVIELGVVGDVVDLADMAAVVVIWRAVWTTELSRFVERARGVGAKIVFDVDDLMIDPTLATSTLIDGIRSQSLTEEAVQGHFVAVQQCMLQADYGLAPTAELAGNMRRFGKSAWVLPNGFDVDTVEVSRLAVRRRAAQREDGLIRLGYAGGSRTHQRDFGQVAPVLPALLRANPACRLVLFKSPTGEPLVDLAEYPEFADVTDQVELRTLVPLRRLPEELARFDINLAPLELDNLFCDAKSELKYFEGALAGVCTVASPTGPYARAIRDGTTGFLASTQAQWAAVLERLVKDPGLRRKVATSALNDVLWSYGPDRRTLLLRDLVAEWLGGADGCRTFKTRSAGVERPARPLPRVPAGEVVYSHDTLQPAAVTVIIPIFNYAHLVTETLLSVAAQTAGLLDLVIVDDASTDGSLAVVVSWVEAHAARFGRAVVSRNLRNAGLALTRNAAFELAETPYVLPLDADNLLRPSCCDDLVRLIEQTGAAFAYPVIQEFGGRSNTISASPWEPNRLAGGNYIDAMALIRKSAWSAVGGYAHLPYGWEDYDFWCMVAEQGLAGVCLGGEPRADYRVHASSMLAQVTDTHSVKASVIAAIERRHPWVSVAQPLKAATPAVTALPSGGVDARRLERLLPILRCPETRQPMVVDCGTLKTIDGRRTWPIKNGRPVLFPTMPPDDVKVFSHLSNELPESALALIRSTPGLILNLSAGGTAERFDNVIEAEAAIFGNTDLIADSHALPFADGSFELVIAMNAFEHYRDPPQAAAEIHRVLVPGGRVLIRTAFMQPQHEAPWHFYNTTRFGLSEWFKAFETDQLHVSDNFNPSYSLAWLAAECEAALRTDGGNSAATRFLGEPIGTFVRFWKDPATRDHSIWEDFAGLSQQSQSALAAGFEYLGHRAD